MFIDIPMGEGRRPDPPNPRCVNCLFWWPLFRRPQGSCVLLGENTDRDYRCEEWESERQEDWS